MITPSADSPKNYSNPPLQHNSKVNPPQAVSLPDILSVSSSSSPASSINSTTHSTSVITSVASLFASMLMKDFVNSLNDAPLETYKALMEELKKHGVDFPFEPYREVLKTIQAFLRRRENFSESEGTVELHDRIGLELHNNPAPRFSSSWNLIWEFVHRYPGNPEIEDYENTIRYPTPLEAIRHQEENGLVVFSFMTPVDLNFMYFVNARTVPVFAHGLGAGPDLIPPTFDDIINDSTRYGFLYHDQEHTRLMSLRPSKIDMQSRITSLQYRISLLQKIIENERKLIASSSANSLPIFFEKTNPKLPDILEQNLKEMENLYQRTSSRTPLVAFSRRLHRFHEGLSRVTQTDLKKAIELLFFFLFHEDEGGGFNFDPVFINKKVLFEYISNSEIKIDNVSELEEQELGLKEIAQRGVKVMTKRLREEFSFPSDYKNEQVIKHLPEAAEWMFKFLSQEHRTQKSEAGQREEYSPEQQELDKLMQDALKKIKVLL